MPTQGRNTNRMRQVGSVEGSKSTPDVVKADAPVDFVAAARRIESLKAEYATLDERMKAIRAEVKDTFALINNIQPEFAIGDMVSTSRRSKAPINPRPVEDKLVISAGRKIVEGVKNKWGAEKSRLEAIAAATACAKKYGQTTLSPAVLTAIDRKIKTRFNLY